MKPPGVEDCPISSSCESYQDVVVIVSGCGVVGVVVVGGNVVVVVVASVVVIDLNFINLCCRRRRRRAILSLLFFSALMFVFDECALLPATCLPLLPTDIC